jgi:hypothetical protein
MHIEALKQDEISPKTGKMNTRIVFWAITSALAGFLFGFDTIVISGAEQTIQKLWGLSPGLHDFVMGSAFFPKMVAQFAPGYVFMFFCCMMVLQLIWVKTMVPETKGISLEDMQRKLQISAS